MPITLSAGEILEVVTHCHCLDQEALNVFHFAISSTVGDPSQDDTADTISAALGPLFGPAMCNLALYEGLTLRVISPATGTRGSRGTAGQTAGAGGPTMLPRQVCGIFTKLSLTAGRRGRGRCYVPFPAIAAQQGTIDVPSAAYIGAVANLATGLTGGETFTNPDASTVTGQWGLWHRQAPQVFTEYDDFRLSNKWATQRRRGDYGRTNRTFP